MPAVAVTQSFCAADAPIWVAYQDGSGAWTRVTSSGNNTYTFNISSGRAGVATVDTVGTGFDLRVTYATAAELNNFGVALGQRRCGAKTVTGTVASVTSTQNTQISLGYAYTTIPAGFGRSFSLTDVPSGPQDLFASVSNNRTSRFEKIVLRRALDVANGGALSPIDFNAADAFAPASATVAVSGLGADTAAVFVSFLGNREQVYGRLTEDFFYVSAKGAIPYDGVPGAQLAVGDLHSLEVGSARGGKDRAAGAYVRTPSNQTIVMGSTLGDPVVTRDNSGAYVRPRVVLAQQAEYNRFIQNRFTQSVARRAVSLIATSGYAGAAAWDLTLPEFTGVAGWTSTWGLAIGSGLTWRVSVSGGQFHLLDASVPDGATFRSAGQGGTLP
jgi:hypothetical protein